MTLDVPRLCGDKWLTRYLELLQEDDKKQVIERKSDASFRFGDNKEIKAIKSGWTLYEWLDIV